jgi:nitroreductase
MIHELIFNRRSAYAFSAKPLEKEKIKELFEAAHLAPSASNIQPWRFIYATRDDANEFNLLFDCLDEGNQRWVKNTYMLMLSVAEITYTYKNEQRQNRYARHDVGTALGMLMVQAASLGLVCHPMAGYNLEKARQNLNIPEFFEPVAMIAVGYPGEIDILPEDLKKRQTSPRNRKPLNEVVFKGKFQ